MAVNVLRLSLQVDVWNGTIITTCRLQNLQGRKAYAHPYSQLLAAKVLVPLSKPKLHSFWTSVIAGNEWSISCPSCFTPGKNHGTVTNWTGGGVCPKTGLDCSRGEKISSHYRDLNPGSSSLKVYLTFDKSSISVKITLLIPAPVKGPFHCPHIL